ncbi:MAG: SURF1-like protein [Actinomycetota bacterium]|nr:MAG: SURF1-like protein [Actinomycetota bacterium]
MPRLPRFLFTPRWLGLLAFALLVAATCVRLGIWQLDRLEQRRAFNASVRAGLTASPVELSTLAGRDPAALAYRRVEVTGTYDPAREVLLYGRALNGEPGHHVLTPLVLERPVDGAEAVLVDRGWVPFELGTPPVAEAAPPSGRITVRGFLLPTTGEADVVIERGPGGRVLTVAHDEPGVIGRELGLSLFPLPLQLQRQDPPQAGALPEVVPPPELTEGPHLSYAIQWFTFATIALVGYVLLVRREIRDRARAAAGG